MNSHAAMIRVLGAVLSLAVAACSAGETDSKKVDVSINLHDEATAADAGLPTYPGSTPYKEDSDDSSSAANIGISTPVFGFKVVAMDLETPDKPERVAAFYSRALSTYGNVLDCSDAAESNRKPPSKRTHEDHLVCDSGENRSHSIVYKVGTEKNQRIVAIEPHGTGTRFSLVHLDVRE